MAEGSGKKQEISLGSEVDAMVRYGGGTTVELNADGNVIVKTKGNAVVYTNGDVKVLPVANDDGQSDTLASPELKIGDRMPDGTVYAGVSPDTNKPMYATPTDAPQTLKWKHVMEFAAKLDAHGHQDWRVPTKNELSLLLSNRAAIGGFDESGSGPAGWYWSSSQDSLTSACDQLFSVAVQDDYYELIGSSLRCVR